MPQVETLWQAPGRKVIGLERDCAGQGLLGRRQDGGKGTKKDGNGVDGLLSQPRQDFTGCLQCSCPGTMKAVLGVGMAEVGPFKFLATVWPHAVEANTRSSAPSLKNCCLLLPPRLCLERLRCSRHGHGSMASPLLPQVYRSQFITRWKELQLDVVLCPVLGPAFTTGYPGKLLSK